jgi:hypothetical protein
VGFHRFPLFFLPIRSALSEIDRSFSDILIGVSKMPVMYLLIP